MCAREALAETKKPLIFSQDRTRTFSAHTLIFFFFFVLSFFFFADNSDEWFKGSCGGKSGIFPKSFVEVITHIGGDTHKSTEPQPIGASALTVTSQQSGVPKPNAQGVATVATGKATVAAAPISNPVPAARKTDVVKKLEGHDLPGQSHTDTHNDADSSLTASVASNTSVLGKARVLHEFTAQHPDDLELRMGDIVEVLENVNNEWMRGRVNNCKGMFPSNFVEMIDTTGRARVLYEFNSNADDELSLLPGEEVVLLEKMGDEWFKGKKGSKEGIFPSSFVEVTKPIQD